MYKECVSGGQCELDELTEAVALTVRDSTVVLILSRWYAYRAMYNSLLFLKKCGWPAVG